MRIKALAGVTIITPDLDAAIAAYGAFLGHSGAAPTAVSAERAARWGSPQAAGARMATLYPESGETRFIRLVEGRPSPDHRPLGSLGWSAAEIVVQDLDALAARLASSPFEIIGPPAVLDFDFTDKIRAMQVLGAGGEVLYLTEIGDQIPGFALPDAKSFVGQLFIMVLGGRSIAEAAAPYSRLGRAAGEPILARVEVLSRAHGLPAALRHSLSTIALDEASLIEVDAFPASATARPASSIGLPSGIAMASFTFEGLAEVEDGTVLRGDQGELIELIYKMR
jgi:catechol 2,3-dioxygenase-like lactoylglutathione lyase family enzyme